MIFTEYEINKIIDALNGDDLTEFFIKSKLEKIKKTSINKRYSLRTTDWLVENGKKSRKRKNKIFNAEILIK